MEPEVKEFFESGGEKAPEDVTEVTNDEVKTEEPEKKSEPEVKEAPKEDPYAENHAKALREARAETRAERERVAKLEEKLQVFMAEVKKTQEPQPPTFEQDPATHLKYENEQVKRQLEEFNQWKVRQEQSTTQQRQMQQFVQHIGATTAPFIQKTPDYQKAYEHVINAKKAELMSAGLDETQVGQALGSWELQFAHAAMQRGKNPAESIYQLAGGLGYKKEEPKQEEDKLTTLTKGMEHSKSLGNGKSGSELSLAALEKMSADDISALVKDPHKWAAITGTA